MWGSYRPGGDDCGRLGVNAVHAFWARPSVRPCRPSIRSSVRPSVPPPSRALRPGPQGQGPRASDPRPVTPGQGPQARIPGQGPQARAPRPDPPGQTPQARPTRPGPPGQTHQAPFYKTSFTTGAAAQKLIFDRGGEMVVFPPLLGPEAEIPKSPR